MEPAEFVLARIADDEFVALAAAVDEEEYGPLGNFAGTTTDARMAHAARWSPGRVRLEASVRRQLVQLHDSSGRPCCGVPVSPCPSLRLLGLPYADHPDYSPEWRP